MAATVRMGWSVAAAMAALATATAAGAVAAMWAVAAGMVVVAAAGRVAVETMAVGKAGVEERATPGATAVGAPWRPSDTSHNDGSEHTRQSL